MCEKSLSRGEMWKRGYFSGVYSAIKGGSGEADGEGGSEIVRLEISGDGGSCLMIGGWGLNH